MVAGGFGGTFGAEAVADFKHGFNVPGTMTEERTGLVGLDITAGGGGKVGEL